LSQGLGVATASTVNVTARGGNGGNVFNAYNGIGLGGTGGRASASADVSGAGAVTLSVESAGGDSRFSIAGAGADGPVSTLGPVRATSTGGRAVTVSGTLRQGAASNGASGAGGNGAAAMLDNAVGGATTGALTLTQTALGGAAGTGATTGGRGGAAESVLTLRDTTAASVSASVVAAGGSGTTPGTSRAAVDVVGAVDVTSLASAGNDVAGGRADATAAALGTRSALAGATGKGALGVVGGDAGASGGRFTRVAAHVAAPVIEQGTVESRASVGTAAPPLPSSPTQFQATAYALASPSLADTDAALGSNSRMRAVIDPAAAVALMTVGGSSGKVTGTQTYSATVGLDVNLNLPPGPHDLLLGLHDAQVAGSGFTSLEFLVRRQGAVVVSQVFSDVPSALTYFRDNVVDLGSAGGGGGAAAAVDVSFTLSTSRANEGLLAGLFLATAVTTPGDGNHDGNVDFNDLVILAQNYNTAGKAFEQGRLQRRWVCRLQ
jgi:hypothetical protein